MSGQEYPPGTVAMVRQYNALGERRALRVGNIGWHLRPSESDEYLLDTEVAYIRPLVVLDLHGFNPAVMLAEMRALLPVGDSYAWPLIIAQIEAQTKPPKPPEPQYAGAVIEDGNGVRWIRVEDAANARSRNPWFPADTEVARVSARAGLEGTP